MNKEVIDDVSDSVARHLNSPAAILSHILGVLAVVKPIFEAAAEIQSRLAALGVTANVAQPLNVTHFHADVHFWSSPRYRHLQRQIQELQERINAIEQRFQEQAQQIGELQSLMHHYSLGSGAHMITMVERKHEELDEQVIAMKSQVSELEQQVYELLAVTAHNGSFIWRIPNVSQRRRDAVNERIASFYSPPFYTSRHGYKMCMRAYFNGEGTGHGTHISLFFVLMRGEFDMRLSWPFKHEVSLILMDQNHRKHIVQTFNPTPDSSSFRRPVSEINVSFGYPRFAEVIAFQDERYMKDDTIFFKCKVHCTLN